MARVLGAGGRKVGWFGGFIQYPTDAALYDAVSLPLGFRITTMLAWNTSHSY